MTNVQVFAATGPTASTADGRCARKGVVRHPALGGTPLGPSRLPPVRRGARVCGQKGMCPRNLNPQVSEAGVAHHSPAALSIGDCIGR